VANSKALPRQVYAGQLLTAAAGCQSTLRLKIGAQQTQQRPGPGLRQVAPGPELTPRLGKGMAGMPLPPNGAQPADRLAADPAAAMGRWSRRGPTSRRRYGVGVVGHGAGAGAHHSHKSAPAPASQQHPWPGRVPLAVAPRSARSRLSSALRIRLGNHGAGSQGRTVLFSAACISGIVHGQDGEKRYF